MQNANTNSTMKNIHRENQEMLADNYIRPYMSVSRDIIDLDITYPLPMIEKPAPVFQDVLSNKKCSFEIDFDRKSISGDDHTDVWNQPRCFSQTWRSNKKAWKALCEQFDQDTTMYGAISILMKNGIRMHSYCAMD